MENENIVTSEREIAVNGLKIKITSLFIGDQLLIDKLFIIADRKLKSD